MAKYLAMYVKYIINNIWQIVKLSYRYDTWREIEI